MNAGTPHSHLPEQSHARTAADAGAVGEEQAADEEEEEEEAEADERGGERAAEFTTSAGPTAAAALVSAAGSVAADIGVLELVKEQTHSVRRREPLEAMFSPT